MESENLVVSVEGVWKRFGDVVANEDITMYVREGEVVSLLGPNGAGKTTLVRQIYGELRPDKGEVLVMGMSPRRAKERGYVSVVPQEAAPFNMLKVAEHVEMLVRLRGLPKAEAKRCAEEAMDAVGLRDYRNKLVYDLSGGMKRLVLVASAMACRPKLIILDEPTVGVDAHNRRRIWEVIRGARDGGSAVVLTTHYIHEAEELSDRVYMINRRIIMEGTPGELRRKLPWVEIKIGDLEKPVRTTWDDAVKVIRELVARRERFEVREPSLEDLFLELFGGSP